MQVLGLPHHFNQEAIKQMTCEEFAKVFEGKIQEAQIIPAWEALTGKKALKKQAPTKKAEAKKVKKSVKRSAK